MACTSWVFSYGSNMHLPDLKRWFTEKGYATKGILEAHRAHLQGYRLVWNYYSEVRRGAAANVEIHPPSHLPGMALLIDSSALQAIDRKEGHPHRYHRGETPVGTRLIDSDKHVNAWVYQVLPAFLRDEYVAPRPEYLQLMIDAAQTHKLGEQHVAQLKQVRTAL